MAGRRSRLADSCKRKYQSKCKKSYSSDNDSDSDCYIEASSSEEDVSSDSDHGHHVYRRRRRRIKKDKDDDDHAESENEYYSEDCCVNQHSPPCQQTRHAVAQRQISVLARAEQVKRQQQALAARAEKVKRQQQVLAARAEEVKRQEQQVLEAARAEEVKRLDMYRQQKQEQDLARQQDMQRRVWYSADLLTEEGKAKAEVLGLLCAVCMDLCVDVVDLNVDGCKHLFCRQCMVKHLEPNAAGHATRNAACPVCRQSSSKLAIRNMPTWAWHIDKLEMRCDKCSWTGVRDALEHHNCKPTAVSSASAASAASAVVVVNDSLPEAPGGVTKVEVKKDSMGLQCAAAALAASTSASAIVAAEDSLPEAPGGVMNMGQQQVAGRLDAAALAVSFSSTADHESVAVVWHQDNEHECV